MWLLLNGKCSKEPSVISASLSKDSHVVHVVICACRSLIGSALKVMRMKRNSHFSDEFVIFLATLSHTCLIIFEHTIGFRTAGCTPRRITDTTVARKILQVSNVRFIVLRLEYRVIPIVLTGVLRFQPVRVNFYNVENRHQEAMYCYIMNLFRLSHQQNTLV
jgi:hypothetical protein